MSVGGEEAAARAVDPETSDEVVAGDVDVTSTISVESSGLEVVDTAELRTLLATVDTTHADSLAITPIVGLTFTDETAGELITEVSDEFDDDAADDAGDAGIDAPPDNIKGGGEWEGCFVMSAVLLPPPDNDDDDEEEDEEDA